MRVGACFLVLAGIALAGCLSDSEPVSGIVPAPGETVFVDGVPVAAQIRLEGCDEQFGVFPVAPELFQGILPEGFEPVPFDDAGAAWTMVSVATTCTVDGEEARDFSGALIATPPEGFRTEEIGMYGVSLGGFTSRADIMDILVAWGIERDYEVGDIEMGRPAPDNPLLRVGQTHGSGSHGSATLTTSVPEGGPGQDSGAVRIFHTAADSNELRGAYDISWTASAGGETGSATFSFAPGVSFQGIGNHYWGEDYGLTLSYVELGL